MQIRPLKRNPTLDELLAKAKARGPLTPAEIWDQRISFTYGNLFESPCVTRKMVVKRAVEMYGPRPPGGTRPKTQG